jgi:hypothetical protein
MHSSILGMAGLLWQSFGNEAGWTNCSRVADDDADLSGNSFLGPGVAPCKVPVYWVWKTGMLVLDVVFNQRI